MDVEQQLDAMRTERDRLARDNASLRRAIELLHRIGNLSRESLELEAVCYAALTGVTAGVGLGFNRAMLFFAQPGPATLEGFAAVGPSNREEADRVWRSIEAAEPDLETLYASGLRQRDAPGVLSQRVKDTSFDVQGESRVALAYRNLALTRGGGHQPPEGLLDDETGIATPIRGRRQVHGVLYADNCFTKQPADDVTAMVFSMVANHTGRAIDNARHFADVAKAARTDALTGLGHHGALMEALARGVALARCSGDALCLAMIDIDDFKQVNDRLGHPIGDVLLATVADRLSGESRQGSVFRYGGEEFAVLLPGADLEHAGRAAERLRRAVNSTEVALGDGRTAPVTCSIGVAALGTLENADALVVAADDALLRAKREGKNRVVFASA